jgi:hypothetical protein
MYRIFHGNLDSVPTYGRLDDVISRTFTWDFSIGFYPLVLESNISKLTVVVLQNSSTREIINVRIVFQQKVAI